jgi:hypothetical protein
VEVRRVGELEVKKEEDGKDRKEKGGSRGFGGKSSQQGAHQLALPCGSDSWTQKIVGQMRLVTPGNQLTAQGELGQASAKLRCELAIQGRTAPQQAVTAANQDGPEGRCTP